MVKSLFVSAALLALSIPALAQNGAPPNPTGFGGAVISTAADSVMLKTKDGKDVKIVMTPGWTVSTARNSTPDAIKPGDFIASINTNIDANSGKSTEVRIFEPGYRPEIGTHPMPMPNTSITHGTVKTSAKTAAGQELEVVYPNGSRHLLVSPEIKVTAYDLHDRNLAKPGAMVSGVTRKDANGVDVAGRLVVAQ